MSISKNRVYVCIVELPLPSVIIINNMTFYDLNIIFYTDMDQKKKKVGEVGYVGYIDLYP